MNVHRAKELYLQYYEENKKVLLSANKEYKKRNLIVSISIIFIYCCSVFIAYELLNIKQFLIFMCFSTLIFCTFFSIKPSLVSWLMKKHHFKEYRDLLIDVVLRKTLKESDDIDIDLTENFSKIRINYEDFNYIRKSDQITLKMFYRNQKFNCLLLQGREPLSGEDNLPSTSAPFNVAYFFINLNEISITVKTKLLDVRNPLQQIIGKPNYVIQEDDYFTRYEVQQLVSIISKIGKECKLIIKDQVVVFAIFNTEPIMFYEKTEIESLENVYKYINYAQQIYDVVLNKLL